MHAGGNGWNLWGDRLSEPEAIAALSGLLRALHHLCGDVSGIRVAGARVSGIRVAGARVAGARITGARITGIRIASARIARIRVSGSK